MAEGLKREALLFGQLAVTDVSRKLVQIFFATTALKKDFGIANPPPPAVVSRLGVVGAGFKIGRASCREKSVDLGGRRIIKKKKKKKEEERHNHTSYITCHRE